MLMALSAKKQKTGSTTESSTSKATNTVVDASWAKVTKGIKHTTMTFNPTIVKTPITPSTATSESNQSLMTEDATVSKSVEMVRPFLKGIEDNSVLIDITGLPNQQLLREALQAFNKDAHLRKGYNDYIGKVSRTRKYMNREIMETCWIHDSPGHIAILQGFNLTDGTFVKGFPSLPANDTIVNVRLDRLPMEPVPVLKSLIKDRLSHFGEVLDYGISFTQGDYVGQGYATLNITPKPDEPAYEILDRIIYFRLDNGTNRQVLLKWQDMPDFCRLCQKPDHCKADCPDAKRYTQCYNCNQHGHVSRNCPRQDNTDTPNKKPTTIPRKDRKVPTPIIPREPNPPIGPRVVVAKTQETTDTESAKKQQQQNKPEPTKEEEEGTDEDNMNIDSPTPQPKSNNYDVTPNADAASAQTSANNTQTLTSFNAAESTLNGQELIKQFMPDDSMKEPLIQERPDLEDGRDGKKLRTEQEQRANLTRRFTRGSAASKFNTDTDKGGKGASDDSQGQETSETAQSNPQHLE
ncbi:uncharacterized protein ATC70_008734 [Mucor velutinosus]|uniref:CCHC-type domain-containing protein n=1 Tax=Mucor velutinosus TaxID=708070 RepID=A0AAN7DNW1_9FUNG|nr:hypothetical protein ATC70_008734 [Mucor velutinosus]